MGKFVITFVSFFVCCFYIPASGHVKDDIWMSGETHLSAYGRDKKHFEVAYTLGYNFTDRFFVGLNLEEAVTLFDSDGVKDHYVSPTAGARLGYEVLKCLDVVAGAGLTCDDEAFKYVYYDGMLRLKGNYKRVIPSIGFGFRYYDAMGGRFENHWRMYVSLGCSVQI